MIDLETNGCPGSSSCDRKNHRIVQIAVLYVKTGALFSSLVKPGAWIPSSSTAIHRISNEDVRTASELGGVMRELRSWVEAQGLCYNDPLRFVAHNAFGFDLPLLRQRCIAAGLPLPGEWIWFDTLPVARRIWNAFTPSEQAAEKERWLAMDHDPPLPPKDKTTNSNLSRLHARYIGTPLQDSHDAAVDVGGLAKILPFILPHATDSDFCTTNSDLFKPLSDACCLTELSGVGQLTATKLAKVIGKPVRTVGQLREALGTKERKEQERILRKVIIANGWVLKALQEINQCPESSFLNDFPYVETDDVLSKLPLDEITRRRLCSDGIRTSDDLIQCFLYELQGNPLAMRSKLNLDDNARKWNHCRCILQDSWSWLCPSLP